MNKISWNGKKFEVATGSDPNSEDLHWEVIEHHACEQRIIDFLIKCGFNIIGYLVYSDKTVKIHKLPYCYLALEDVGTGFNILFHPLGYILTGKDIEIVESSVKPSLHPLLWETVKKALTNDECVWLSPVDVRHFLKCAVNPSGDCGNCQHYEPKRKQKVKFV